MNIERIQLDFNKRKYDALEQSFSRMSQGSVITELEKYEPSLESVGQIS